MTYPEFYVILYDVDIAWTLSGVGERPSRLVRAGRPGRPAVAIHPVLTVQEVCRRLRRSRRQVYRYLKGGRLRPCAQVLGQWLFSMEEVRRFRGDRLPAFLKPFFWDTRLADLSLERNRDFVLARLLESGDRRALRWVFKAYRREELRSFLEGRGAEVLSERTRHFWLLLLGEEASVRSRPSWRRRGRRWGGIE
ncbi:MAG: helix-turn-helix domain-containing protein [Candidatus Omnitrophica bacterium]|nr:helix-turn-helix domain-containing protein [Candidatus Omnitrophota bacterium]